MARPRRLLLTSAQLQAIHDRGEGHTIKEIARAQGLSSECVRRWFQPGAFVRTCSDTFKDTDGRTLYPDSSEIMRRYEEACLLIPDGQEFALPSREHEIRQRQVSLIFGDIPSIPQLWSLQRIAFLRLIMLESLSGEYVTTRIWKSRHKFVDSEEEESAQTERPEIVPADRHWHKV